MAALIKTIAGDILGLVANWLIAALPLLVSGGVNSREASIELVAVALVIGAFGAIPTTLCLLTCRTFKVFRSHKLWVQAGWSIFCLGYWYWQLLNTIDSEASAILEGYLIVTIAGTLSGFFIVYRRLKSLPPLPTATTFTRPTPESS